MLILHPPITKPCEPPAALGYLSAALEAHGQKCKVYDMNIEGLHYLFETGRPAGDTWSRRAFKTLRQNIAALRSEKTYHHADRYRRAVADVNRVLEIIGKEFNIQLSLANYQDNNFSPLKSDDLLQVANDFSANIFYPYFSAKLAEILESDSSPHIGLSLNYLSQAHCCFAIAGYLKKNYPRRKIVIGGGLVTTWLSNPEWRNPFGEIVDHFIGGRGESPLLKLLGENPAMQHITPDFTTLRENNYLSPGFILPYATSSGCFWRKCRFCPETSENNPYHHLQPEVTVKDLNLLTASTTPVLIHLLDNSLSPTTLQALSENPLPVPWYGFVRFDPALGNMDFCRHLRRAGCTMLKLGLESGDQTVLNSMAKGIHLGLVSRVLHNLHEAGISTYVYLLFGTPAESRKEAERTLDFVEKHHQLISFLNLAIFNLPSCSREIPALAVSDFYEGDLAIYRNFSHPRGWSRGEVRRFLDTTFKRSPGIAAILRNDPPLFTSNHAPFMKSATLT